jgi:hypothetical protein
VAGRLELEAWEVFGVDAEVLLDGFGEEGFGVDGAGEMHVEVGALGEGLEEGVELAGPMALAASRARVARASPGVRAADLFWATEL